MEDLVIIEVNVYEFKQLEQVFFLWASATKSAELNLTNQAVNDERFNKEVA